jgi:hypothetical protein
MTQFLPATVPALDSDGNVLANSTWNFFYQGSLTPAATTTGAQITADSDGEFAGITLEADVEYRAVLKNAAGSVIADIGAVVDNLFSPAFKRVDDTGTRWKFYTTGTTTPQSVYADEGLAVPLGSFIRADAAGRFPVAYLDDAVSYKAVLVDGDDDALATIDPVSSATMQAYLNPYALAPVAPVDSFAIVAHPRPDSSSSHASTSALEWAGGLDAHATLDSDTQIRVGRVITAVSTTTKIPATATKLRARVFSRANTENGVPEGGYDTLLVDTGGVVLADAGFAYDSGFSGYGIYALELPTPFTVEASKCYLIVWEFQDAGGSRVSTSVPYKTVASGAFRLGGYLDTGAGWANYSTARKIPMGMGVAAEITPVDEAPVLVRPIESLFLREPPPAARAWHYPGVATAAFGGEEGLARVLGRATWTPGNRMGEDGVTFGCRIATGSLTDLATDPEYSAGPPARLLLTSSDTANSARHTYSPYEFVYRGGKLLDAYADIQGSVDAMFEDCLFDADGSNIVNGIAQTGTPGFVRMNHVTMRGFNNNNALLANTHLSNCSLDFTAVDTINSSASTSTHKLWVDNCLLRRPGNKSHPFANPSAHSDVIGLSGTQSNTRLIGSTLYYTADASDYSEGVYGDTSGIAMDFTGVANSNWFIGSIIGGGSYNVYLGCSNSAARANNLLFINNLFLADGYASQHGFYCYNYVAGAQLKNFFLWDNFGADGATVRLRGSRLPLAANVPAIAAGAQITITTHIEPPSVTAYQWVPNGGTALRGFFGYDAATLGDAELEAIIELQNNYGVEIIDPDTFALNPLYNLGSWVNS